MQIPVEEYLPAPSLEAEQPNTADVRCHSLQLLNLNFCLWCRWSLLVKLRRMINPGV